MFVVAAFFFVNSVYKNFLYFVELNSSGKISCKENFLPVPFYSIVFVAVKKKKNPISTF